MSMTAAIERSTLKYSANQESLRRLKCRTYDPRKKVPARAAVSLIVSFAAVLWAQSFSSCLQRDVIGQEPPLSGRDEIAALIDDLGNDDFLLRQKSTERLLELGPQVIPPLSLVAGSFDEEVNARARGILKVLREKDYKQRVEGFINASNDSPSEDSASTFGFDDWPAFANVVGRRPSARKLLVAIYEDGEIQLPGSFLKNAFKEEDATAQQADDQSFVDEFVRGISAESYCAEMFRRLHRAPQTIDARVVIDPKLALIQHYQCDSFERYFVTRLSIAKVEQSGFEKEFRDLLTAWLKHELANSPLTRRRIQIINAYQLSAFADALLSSIQMSGYLHKLEALEAFSNLSKRVVPLNKQNDLDAVLGKDAAIKELRSLLSNEETVIRLPQRETQGPVSISIGEIAFQLILTLDEKEPNDFGMKECGGTMPYSGESIYSFAANTAASEMHLKWAADDAENK